MTVNYTTLLGLAQPVSGTESGTWGDTVNTSVTQLVEDSVAGVATASVLSANWTLSTTGSGATNEARKAILIPTGSPGVSRNIIAPSLSKAYIVINQSNAAVVLKGAATTGVTIASGKTSIVAWNGSDFVEISPSTISGILPVANGGTGNTTGTATINANLTGAITSIGNAASLGSFTSANLAAALTDETGTGANVFANAPTFPAQINLTANSGYNIYASGTADNYLAGSLGVGGAAPAATSVGIYKNISGATDGYGVFSSGQVQSSVTNGYTSFYSNTYTQATSFTLSNFYGFQATQASVGAGSTITSQFGFAASSALTGATNNYGFYGAIPAGTGRYNLYMGGTADNYLAGRLGVGATCGSDTTIQAGRTLTGSTTQWGVYHTGIVNSDVTANAAAFRNITMTQAASFTLGNYWGYMAAQGTLGAGSAIGNQYGFYAENSLTGATNNFGFYGGIAAGTGRYNLYMAGTADNYLAGSLGIGTSSPNASAILDAQSTTKGVRMPNMTTTQKNAIASPAAGLMVFDTTSAKLCVYTGAAWQTITSV